MYERLLDTGIVLVCVIIGYVLGRLRETPPGAIEERIKRLLRMPKGGVLVDDENSEVREKEALKQNFFKEAEKNPLTPLPPGLTPEDFR